MDDAVFKLGELRIVPTVGRTDKIAGYTLEAIDVVTMAIWTFFKILLRVLISAVHASVAVMVDGSIADVVPVHQIDNIGNSLGVVGGITIDLHIEYMASACQLMIWSFNFCLVTRRAMIIDRNMI